MLTRKFQLSTLAISIVVLVCLSIDLSFKNWEKQDRVIEWDVHSYYAYLPAFFIYDDIHLEKSDYKFDDDYYLFWPSYTEDGRKIFLVFMESSKLNNAIFRQIYKIRKRLVKYLRSRRVLDFFVKIK